MSRSTRAARIAPPDPRQLSLLWEAADEGAGVVFPSPQTDTRPPAEASSLLAPAADPLQLPRNLLAPHPLTAPPAPTPAAGVTFRHPAADREIRLGEALVAYEFKRGRRKTIGMVVNAQGLSVRAPRWVGVAEIESALREKAGWICAKLVEQHERARKQEATRIDWREGASLPYLGEPVILVLDPRITGARLHDDAEALPGVPRLTLHVGLPQTAGPDQLRDAVQAWLQREAKRIFAERCTYFAQRLGVAVTKLSLSNAQTRWGSASADGSIRLNWRLIHFGMPTIDYVVAHELAHLREMNHSPRFWDVVRSVVPDFNEARERLKTEMLPLLDG